jgi:protein TonB
MPPVDIDIVNESATPPPPPEPALPQPRSTVPPLYVAPLPDEVHIATPQEPTVTGSPNIVPADKGWSDLGARTSDAAASTAPRAVARPAIANVQACAPGGADYPAAARRAEATGLTRLRFTIDASGTMVRSEVLKSAGSTREHRQLDKVAQDKLSGCHFTAGTDELGRPMGGTFEVDYVWRLE